MDDVKIRQLPFNPSNLLPSVIQGGLKLKKYICVDG
jgi:hypothetical protein